VVIVRRPCGGLAECDVFDVKLGARAERGSLTLDADVHTATRALGRHPGNGGPGDVEVMAVPVAQIQAGSNGMNLNVRPEGGARDIRREERVRVYWAGVS